MDIGAQVYKLKKFSKSPSLRIRERQVTEFGNVGYRILVDYVAKFGYVEGTR